jgi:transposase-like protein
MNCSKVGELSYRDLAEMMAERGLSMAQTTIMHWVHYYALEFERRWNQFARLVRASLGVDETYVKIRGKYRNIGRLIARAKPWTSVLAAGAMSPRPKHSFARRSNAASHRSMDEMKADGQIPEGTKARSSKYLNNLIDQDPPPGSPEAADGAAGGLVIIQS